MEKRDAARLPFVLVRGLAGSILLTAAAVLILGFLLFRTNISEGTIHIAVVVVYGISCLAAGFYCGRKMKSRRFLWGLIAGCLYFAVLCAVTMAVHDGRISAHALTSALVCLGSGMLGGMISG